MQIRVDRVREALAFAAGRPYESAAPRRAHRARGAARPRGRQRPAQVARGARRALSLDPGDDAARAASPDDPFALHGGRDFPLPGPPSGSAPGADRGFSEEDARDLVLFAGEDEPDPRRGCLEEGRLLRQAIVAALEEGLWRTGTPRPSSSARELVASRRGADAGDCSPSSSRTPRSPPTPRRPRRCATAPSPDSLAAIARRVGPAAPCGKPRSPPPIRPPDNRKGNRRLHYEKVAARTLARRRARSRPAAEKKNLEGTAGSLRPERARKDREECGPGSYQD